MPDHPRSTPKPARPALRAQCILLCLLSLILCGCYSHHEYSWPEVSVSGPGWIAYNGQTAWKPTPRVPELAGDLFLSMNTNGQTFMEFSKTLPFLTAEIDDWHWQINIPSQKQVYSGRLPPPSHFAFLQLPALLRHEAPASPWQFTGGIANWQITNPQTGESLSGFLNLP
jgi:hypothetical protein